MESKIENKEILHIDILSYINYKKNEHGIKEGDYKRYRIYCKEKISRIRHSCKINKKEKFKKKKVENEIIINDVRELLIELFNAERCWARAMEIKNIEKQNPRRKHYIERRLKKCIKYGEILMNLIQNNNCDNITKLECHGYLNWIYSIYHLYNKNWNLSFKYILQSKKAYEIILKLWCQNKQKYVYLNKIEELTTNEKYCIYNIEGTKNEQNIIQLHSFIKLYDNMYIEYEHAYNVENVYEIVWLDRKIIIKNEKVKEFLDSINNKEESSVEIVKNYLIKCKESIEEIKGILKKDSLNLYINDILYNKGGKDIEDILNLLHYHKLVLLRERNNITIFNMLKKLTSISLKNTSLKDYKCKIYLRLINQSLKYNLDILNIIQHDNISNSSTLLLINFSNFVYNQCRCFFTSISMKLNQKYQDSACLMYKSMLYYKSIKTFDITKINNCDEYKYLNDISLNIENMCSILKIDYDILALCGEYKISDTRPIYNRLDNLTFNELAFYFPPPISIPCEPLLLHHPAIIKDSALSDYIKFPHFYNEKNQISPSEHTDLQSKSSTEPTQESSGISGFIKSWIWG